MATYADRFRDLLLKGGRRQVSDELGWLAVDHSTHGALERAGFKRVSDLRARLEEHGSLQGVVPGIGPKREADIRAALELYDDMQPPLDDPVLRAPAVSIAAINAASALSDAIELSADREWSETVRRFCDEVLIPEARMSDLTDKTMVAEAREVLRATRP